MGCKNSKKVRQVHNHGFDLIDTDGDHKVGKQELEIVSTYLHRYMVNRSAEDHNVLVNTEPIKYLYQIVDKEENSTLTRKDFNKVAYVIPSSKWQNELLPILRKNEIERLKKL